MEKITCPSCGAEIADDGSAVYRKADKSAAIDALRERLRELEAYVKEKLERTTTKGEKGDDEDENGEPFSEFEK